MQNKIKKISGILLVAIILCLPNFVFANSIIKEKVKTLSNDNVFAYYNYYGTENPKDPYSNENSNDVYDNSEHNYRKSETPKTGDKISINTYIIISLLSIIALSVAGEMAKRNIIK